VSENWVKVNNRAVRYVVKGDGKPMVMVHGYNFSADDWINCCGDGLRGFRIYAVDMPYGPKSRSEHFRPREPDDYANHLYGIIKALNVTEPIVVGASLGGETVLRYLALVLHEEVLANHVALDAQLRAQANEHVSSLVPVHAVHVEEVVLLLPHERVLAGVHSVVYVPDVAVPSQPHYEVCVGLAHAELPDPASQRVHEG